MTKNSAWSKEDIQHNMRNVVEHSSVDTVEGGSFEFPFGDHPITICAHSDTPGALEVVKAMREVADEFNAKHFPEYDRNKA